MTAPPEAIFAVAVLVENARDRIRHRQQIRVGVRLGAGHLKTRNAQGWPEIWANFRPLIEIISHFWGKWRNSG